MLKSKHALSSLQQFVQDLLVKCCGKSRPISSIQGLKIRFDPLVFCALMVGHGYNLHLENLYFEKLHFENLMIAFEFTACSASEPRAL
jgi:hypothetical protein